MSHNFSDIECTSLLSRLVKMKYVKGRGLGPIFDGLTASQSEIAKAAGIDVASVRRVREGIEPVRRATFNKLKKALEEKYAVILDTQHFETVPDPTKG